MEIIYSDHLETISSDPVKGNIFTQASGQKHFSPPQLFALSLGSCMLTLMGMKAKELGVAIKGLRVNVDYKMIKDPQKRIGEISCHFQSPHSFDLSLQEEMEKAAIDCPVHKSIHPDIDVHIEFYTDHGSRIGFWAVLNQRNLQIANGTILEIWSRLRSANFESLTSAQNRLMNHDRYGWGL